MKKRILYLLCALTIVLSSCEKYLTVEPSDAMFLQDVQALKQTLGAWLYMYDGCTQWTAPAAPAPWILIIDNYKFLLYDNVFEFSVWDEKSPFGEETQKRIVDRVILGGSEWVSFYAIIGYLNVILNEIDTAEGDEDMRNYVKGEALMHRAYCFFKLLQYYSPMDDASMGIPLYLDSYGSFEDADLSRKNQKEVFNRIISDILETEKLLGITRPKDSYNIYYSYDYVYRILAQVYQWKACGPVAEDSDWEKAAKAAKKAIEHVDHAKPIGVTELINKFWGNGVSSPPSVSNTNTHYYPEALFYQIASDNGLKKYLTVYYDTELWKEYYKANDDRTFGWFGLSNSKNPIVDPSVKIPINQKRRNYSFFGIINYPVYWNLRLAETYLILLEAYAHTNYSEGLKILEEWQSVRYSGDKSTWPKPANAEELQKEVRLERKREFFMEMDIPWLDMKRYNVSGGITREISGYTATPLEPYDFRYNFMIPDSETTTNTKIKINPGWEEYRTM